ncbi:MAG: alanine--tRNA ligase-related protein [Weeksellaceae bacterium]
MKTKQIYLDNSYFKMMFATILEVQEEDGKYRVLLDQTVFYPMGGGQPTDQGTLTSDDWTAEVYQVMMKDGEIWHYLNTSIPPTIGMNVTGELNWERRFKNMRVHSAGHIIDFALHLAGASPEHLQPLKGDHGKKPYILYQGQLNRDYRLELETKANELVEKNLEFSFRFVTLEELQKEAIYLQPGLPTDKQLRALYLETVGAVADGGTQVKRTGEVGKITIPSIFEEDGMTKIVYSVE